MSLLQRVLWSEGMFLGPQHLQQWDRHAEGLIDERLKTIQPRFWGFTELEIDRDALHAGRFVLGRCRGVFHDGTCFRIPEDDAPPGERMIAEAFHPSLAELKVHLALPRPRTGGMVVKSEKKDRANTRYIEDEKPVPDDVSGIERDIKLLRKNLRILLGGEPPDDYVTLPLAVLRRGSGGGFELSPSFVPPCLHLAASPTLVAMLQRVFEALSAKSDRLATKRWERFAGTGHFTVAAATGFWLLHTINSHLPLVMHYFHEPRVHPEMVYRSLASLVGELFTFARGGKFPKDIPLYVHDDPGPVFHRLEEEIAALDWVITERCVSIPLTPQARDTLHGRVHDESLFERADFYLAVHAEMPIDDLVRTFPAVVKISSPELVQEARDFAKAGVKIVPVPNPPVDLIVRGGFQCFQITKTGDHWNAIRVARMLAICLKPPFLDGAQIECLALKKDPS